MRLSSVERFRGFAEPAREAVVDEGELQDAFEGFEGGLENWAVLVGMLCSGRLG